MTVALIFPGQGSQAVGMGRALLAAFPEARRALEEVDEALGEPLSRLISEGPEAELGRTANTQPALLAVSVAAHRALCARAGGAAVPAFFAGHSLGEYSALVAAGALSLRDAARAVRARGTFMQAAVAEGVGSMAAIIGLQAADVEAACASARGELPSREVQAANFNAPDQTVISGHADAVERASALCKARGARRALKLSVSAPFHCALMAPVQPLLARALAEVRFRPLAAPVVSNFEALPYGDPARAPGLLIAQAASPVRWVESVRQMIALGVTDFIELGPGQVLSGLVARISPTARAVTACDPAAIEEAAQLLSPA